MHEVIAEVAGNLIPVDVSVSAGEAIPVEVGGGSGGGGGGGGNVQASKSVSYTPSETAISDTVQPDEGYDSMAEVAVSVGAIPANYVGSSIDRNDSTDMMISENNPPTVLAPAGYYAADARMTVPAGTAGTPSATKGAVSNHAIEVTPSVTNSTGWIAGGTKNGTPVTVQASELVSGNKAITENGDNIDVTNYETVSVNVSGGGTPAYVYDDTDEYTFAEATSGTPAQVYPSFIGNDWTSTATSNRRMWYCYSTNNGAQTNAFLFASIAIGTSNPPGSVVNGRQNSSGVTSVSTGTGSAITVKFTAGATVKIVKLKNPKIDSFS